MTGNWTAETAEALRTQLGEARYDAVRARTYVALDVADWDAAASLVDALGPAVDGYKVGLELFHAAGWDAVRRLAADGKRIFLDVKLHDIPTTVARALSVICREPIELVNVHATGGEAMLRAASEAVRATSNGVKLIGVTVLTSLGDSDLRAVGITGSTLDTAVRLAQLCQRCDLDGVVASALDIHAVRAACGPSFSVVVPGTRPLGAQAHDQRRSRTPGEAMRAGATHLVLGRAVTQAAQPLQAIAGIWDELLAAMEGVHSAHGEGGVDNGRSN
ncbi:MAG: orotidine-5'-phosphate decarboxylase [Alicyclobacillus sp.]|nr:orotidine-5'-phosphate decarboxylase [Alicyclobacillus sp.]